MPIKGTGDPSLHETDRFDGGVTWIAHPDEAMQRASHALVVPNEETDVDDVWLIDPVDAPGLDELLAELGEVAGVVCGVGRHKRDCAALATRHGVPVYVPGWMNGVATELDAPVERFGRRLADTGFQAIRIRDSTIPPWQEVGLFDGETLVVPESLGTAGFFRTGEERLGVHPMLRLTPPRDVLSGRRPERVLVGHGHGVFDDAADAVESALDTSRRNAPSLYVGTVRSLLGI